MLNRNNLEIAALCSKEESRYALGGIYVEPGKTVVTDSHILVIVNMPEVETADFPLTPGLAPTEDFTPFILSRKDALDISREIPVPKRDAVSVLGCAAIGAESNENSKAFIGVPSKDWGFVGPRVFHPDKQEGQFPNYQLVIPDKDKVKPTICFDLKVLIPALQQLAKVAGKDSPAYAIFRIEDATSAMRVDIKNDVQSAIAVVMPCHMPDES